VARQEIAAPDGPETHLARKRVPVTQSTILSSGLINGADTLTIEVIQPDSMPAVVRILWPNRRNDHHTRPLPRSSQRGHASAC
jgi:hypothetical protein